MGSQVKQLIFGCEYALLPAGVKALQGKFDQMLGSGYLRASCEYRHESRTFLVICSPQHEDKVSRMFQDILRELIRNEVGLEFRRDDEEINSKLVGRVRYDLDNVELPGDFVDKKEEWPSQISAFAFKSIWVYLTKNNAQPRLIPKYRQKALKALSGIELLEDLDSQCIYIGAGSPDDLASALHKLDMLKKQVDSFKPGDSHVFYTEHKENFQLGVRLIPSVKKRLQNTTLLDPVHNKGTTKESYHALNLASTIRCCPFDPIGKIFVLKSGEKLFPLVSSEAKENCFLPWEDYVYTKKGTSPVTRQQNYSPLLIDFEENDVTSVTRQRNDSPHLTDIEEDDISSVTREGNDPLRLPDAEEDEVTPVLRQRADQLSFLVDFDEDDAISQLEPSERIQNVANWLLTGLPDIPANTSLQLSHGLYHHNQDAVKSAKVDNHAGLRAQISSLPDADTMAPVRPVTPEQANPKPPQKGKHTQNLLELLSGPDVELLIPLDENPGQNLLELPQDQSFDCFSSLKDGEQRNLAGLSPSLMAKSQSSMESVEDLLHFSPQKQLLSERDKIQARDGSPKPRLNTPKAPGPFGTVLDRTKDGILVASPSALLPWNLNNKFQQTADPVTGVTPPQTISDREPEPAPKLALYRDTVDANHQNHKAVTKQKASSISTEAAVNEVSPIDPTAVLAKTSEYFDKAISAGIKPITANMRWWQGEVTLEAQLGRILIRGYAPHLIDASENSFPAEEVSHLLKSNSNSIQFTKLLSTLPADAQFILDMKSDTNDQLWGPAVKKSVTYQYDCSYPGSERFIIEMDAQSFKTRVKSLPSKLGCIYVHGTLRNFDYRIIALGTRNLDSEHSHLADAIADTLYVEVKLNRVLLWFKLSKDLNVEVDAIRVHHRSHHVSPNGKSILNISEVHDLDVDQAKSYKWMTYRAHSPDSITQPLWYEMSVSSIAVEEILQENRSLELGKEAAWAEGTLTGKGTILRDICLPANLLIKRIDGLGFFNKNPNDSQQLLDDADITKTSPTQEQPIVYW